jgi:hypothetical protein
MPKAKRKEVEMATRALIGRLTGWDGNYPMGEGVYHHWDGYPAGLGAVLFKLFRDEYQGDMEKMLKEIVDDHPGGWSYLADRDCYCHTRGEEMARGFGDLRWASRCGCEWAYLFTVQDGKPMMVVARHLAEWDDRSGKLLREWWESVGIVSLDGEEPDWEAIEMAGYKRYDAIQGGTAAGEAGEGKAGSGSGGFEGEESSTARESEKGRQGPHRRRGDRGRPGQRGKANRGTARHRP